MASRTERSKELSTLIGDLVKVHIKGPGEAGTNVHAVQGILMDVTSNFVYLGEDFDQGFTVMIDIDSVYIINLVGEVELMEDIDVPDGEVH